MKFQLIRSVHVNIHDFIRCKSEGVQVKPIFRSYHTFRAYTFKHHKFYPLKKAKKNPVFRLLLDAGLADD